MGVKFSLGVCTLLLATILLFTGCANYYTAPFKPPTGWIVTQQRFPLTVPDTTLNLEGLASEYSESTYFCWPYPTFDVAFGNKKALGRLPDTARVKTVEFAELEVFTIFGVFGNYKVVYYGQPGPNANDRRRSRRNTF